MSGIVAIWNLDGAPVDGALLGRMTQSLEVAGPDAQRSWVCGPIGLGHAMFRTTHEARDEVQPTTLNQRTWITADARIDARADLIRELAGRGIAASISATDAELILHSYAAWGEECVHHLLGDFSFVIWDSERRRVFCARDHLGIKPFFYSMLGRTLIISNSLFCVQRHPRVSKTLNELAIADFLLFELNYDPATTAFRDIQRLPPANVLKFTDGGDLHAERYWTLSVDEPLLYRDRGQYVEQFRELLDSAIRDRVRCDWIGVFMSGGLDSAGLAIWTQRQMREQGINSGVHAFTYVFTNLIPDDERFFAQIVADSGGFPIHFEELDQTDEVPQTGEPTPEPVAVPWLVAAELARLRRCAAHGRVFFYGEGPDNGLRYEWRPYLRYLARTGRWPRIVADVVHTTVAHRRLLWFPTLPGIFEARRYRAACQARFPTWLNPSFARRVEIQERWKEIQNEANCRHPIRPIGVNSFGTPLWTRLFARYDPENTGVSLEVRHPYLDLRVLRFLLAVPALPWCRNKYLIRRAFRGILPKRILERPKTSLRGDPEWERTRRVGLPSVSPSATALGEYVEVSAISESAQTSTELWTNFRPIALNWWLRGIV